MNREIADDTIFVLKQDLKTENCIFRAGTRVTFEKKYHTIYYDCYHVYSADQTDYMYIHRTEELKELVENILEVDADRTDQYRNFLSETHINVSAILIIVLYVTGFIAFSVFLWKSDTSMNFIETLFFTFVVLVILTMSCFIDICLSVVKIHKETERELVSKRNDFLRN